MSKTIDLRSDTVTRPTDEMRKAIYEAPVGDDVYGEDPTVNELQEMSADILGFESALFAPSGSMGNQVSIASHTDHGEEIIVEKKSHIFNYELAGASFISGVMPRPISTEDGILPLNKVKEAVQEDTYYLPRTGLVTMENTHNNQGGRVYPQKKAKEVIDFAHGENIKVHLDGARVFNAAQAAGKSPSKLTEGFDSVMFCLSKGLGCPVGSMVVGSEDFIEKAKVARKRLGGGMRQVGILAAAGVYALENHVERLKEDHSNAKRLADGLYELGFEVDPQPPESNIFFTSTEKLNLDAYELQEKLAELGIKIGPRNREKIRMVTHLDINEEEVEFVLDSIRDILQKSG